MDKFVKPKWVRELFRFLPVKSQFVLWGNVYYVYPFESDGGITTLSMCDFLLPLKRIQQYGL